MHLIFTALTTYLTAKVPLNNNEKVFQRHFCEIEIRIVNYSRKYKQFRATFFRFSALWS